MSMFNEERESFECKREQNIVRLFLYMLKRHDDDDDERVVVVVVGG